MWGGAIFRLLATIALAVTASNAAASLTESKRPVLRNDSLAAALGTLRLEPDGSLRTHAPTTVQSSLRPQVRPKGLSTRQTAPRRATPLAARRTVTTSARNAQPRSSRGVVCGTRSVIGQLLTPIEGRLQGCGIDKPVRVTSVAGVKLSQSSVMDCRTAKALERWVSKGVKPAVGAAGGGPAKLRVMGHYSCRTRNNRKGAKISEHGKGRAIDIGGVTLKNGTELSVLRDWGRGKAGKALKKMHRAACGPFGTVLGPEADRFHQDHFHFDTARYRSGSYCR